MFFLLKAVPVSPKKGDMVRGKATLGSAQKQMVIGEEWRVAKKLPKYIRLR